AAVVGPAEALQETCHREVERGILVVGYRLGTDHGPPDVTRDLHALARLGLTRVGLVGEHHVGPGYPRRQLRNLVELFLQVAAEAVRNRLLAAGHGDFHRILLELRNDAETWAVSALYPSGTTSWRLSGPLGLRFRRAPPATASRVGLPIGRH